MAVAQNKLGELAVNIGLTGLSKTLKGLNSVSASFLLTKTAAQQMIQPIVGMQKQFNNTITGMDKFAAVTGLTAIQQDKLAKYLKLNRTNLETFQSSFVNFQNKIAQGELGAPLEEGFLLAGINIRDYANKSIFELFDAVDIAYKKILKSRGEKQASNFLSMIGLDPYEFAYLFQHKSKPLWEDVNSSIDDSLILTEKLHKNINDNIDATKKLEIAWDSLKQKGYGAAAPALTAGTNYLSDVLEGNASTTGITSAIGAAMGLKQLSKNKFVKKTGKKLAAKAAAKVGGKAVGTILGSAVGMPFLGLAIGAGIDYAIDRALNKNENDKLENIPIMPSDTNGNYTLTPPPNIDNRHTEVKQYIYTNDPVKAGNTAVEKFKQFEILDTENRYEPIQY